METIFDTVCHGVQAPLPHSRAKTRADIDLATRLQDEVFAKARVHEILSAEVRAMRAAGFHAELLSDSIGVANYRVHWAPIRAGDPPGAANAEFAIEATGFGAYRAMIHFINDESEPVSFPLYARELTEQVLVRWFETFLEACLTACAAR